MHNSNAKEIIAMIEYELTQQAEGMPCTNHLAS